MRRRRIVVGLAVVAMIAAAIELVAGDHPAVAIAARTYPTYTPASPATLVASVPPKDPREVALRQQLRAAPDRVDLAVRIARADIQRSRSLSDPRYLGRAQATLAPWWELADPPPDVRLLRATIRQALHDFTGARADLDRLVALRPDDVQAHLTRAVVSTITADYGAARESCAVVARLTDALIAATCLAPIDGITGRVDAATAALGRALDASPSAPPEIRTWSITGLAELAIMRADYATAEKLLRDVLAIDPDDAYARAGLADVLIWTDRAAQASQITAGREVIDNLLVRRAIAEHLAKGPEAAKWAKAMHDRIAAAAERGDRIHMREEAMFTLAVDRDAKRALAIALDDWAVQKELADARLVASCAVAAGTLAAAEPVRAWMRANHVPDAQLVTLLGAP